MPTKIIAVTGTNGKTSIVDLTRQLASFLNIKIGSIGTEGVFINDQKIKELENTTPDVISFYRILADLKKENCELVIFEASSHGLTEERFFDLEIDVAIFTNLSQDHLDYHKNMQNYFAAKSLLFTKYLKKEGTAIINDDDDYGKKLCEICRIPNLIKYNKDSLYKNSPLKGNFQQENLNASILALKSLGYDEQEILDNIHKIKAIKGRLEEVEANIFIDYAHTPDALKKVLIALKTLIIKE